MGFYMAAVVWNDIEHIDSGIDWYWWVETMICNIFYNIFYSIGIVYAEK